MINHNNNNRVDEKVMMVIMISLCENYVNVMETNELT